jgi:hypothetical protein
MFDITTGTGDFIANGVVSHNCYARPTHEYLGLGAGTDFERKITVKPEAPRLLREAFERPSWKGDLIAFSGVTDCYQPLEASYQLTRGCLEVCREYRNPVAIITKAPLVERDIDLLVALSKVAPVSVTVSIPLWDRDHARALAFGDQAERVRGAFRAQHSGRRADRADYPGRQRRLLEGIVRVCEAGARACGYVAAPAAEVRTCSASGWMRIFRWAAHVMSLTCAVADNDARFGTRMKGEGRSQGSPDAVPCSVPAAGLARARGRLIHRSLPVPREETPQLTLW